MKFGSVCSGIEAASVAFEPLGWKAAWFSEIEPFPCAVLKHHYPDTPNYGDMTTLPEKIRSGEVEAPDLFCGGTPCQAFSVAGLRQSLSDDRGNLSLTFCEIANAIDHVRSARGEQPCIVFWENVPGVLSTTDNAFGCFLGALSGCDSPISPGRLGWTDAGVVAGPQRTVAWRVLDAQYFGLAQRRRRVFVVASARDGFNPAEVLLEFQGVRRDFAPSRETGQRVAPTIAGCANGGGANGPGRDVDSVESLQVAFGGNNQSGPIQQAAALNANRGCHNPGDFEAGTLLVQGITHSLRGEGFDASEDGTGRGTPLVPVAFHPTQDPINSTEVCHSLGANENATAAVMQPIAVPEVTATLLSSAAGFSRTGGSVTEHETYIPMAAYPAAQKEVTLDNTHAVMQSIPFGVGESHDLGHCLRSGASKADKHESTTYVTQVIPIDSMNHIGRGDAHSFGDFQPGAPSYTLTKGHSHAVAVAQQPIAWDEELNASVDQAGTLLRGGQGGRHDGVATPRPLDPYLGGDITIAIDASYAKGCGGTSVAERPVVEHSMQVRRLTPMECERLQGFPDGYTNIPWRGKPESPDGPRYKALGNSWAVPCVQWIGRRIQQGVQGKVPS